jgi:hypothetical protein
LIKNTYKKNTYKKWRGVLAPHFFALASMLASAAATDLPGLNTPIMLVNTITVSWAEAL